jgi:hypothetical protein
MVINGIKKFLKKYVIMGFTYKIESIGLNAYNLRHIWDLVLLYQVFLV